MGYFKKEELRVFSEENSIKNDSAVRKVRNNIKQKLLDINEIINDRMNKLGLYHHKDTEHIVSLTIPCVFNKGKVNWLGIRYGKHPDIIDKLNFGIESKDEAFGFQRHNCFQLDVSNCGVEIGLYHAVPNDSVDRMYMHEHLNEDSFRELVSNEILDLVGYGFVWNIGGDGFNENFDIDAMYSNFGINVGEEFCKWYEKYDKDGCYSSMLIRYGVDDVRVKDIDGIISEFFSVVERLLDLWKIISWV